MFLFYSYSLVFIFSGNLFIGQGLFKIYCFKSLRLFLFKMLMQREWFQWPGLSRYQYKLYANAMSILILFYYFDN